MPSTYTNEKGLLDAVGRVRLTALLDRSDNGAPDPGVLARAIAYAGRVIDRKLKKRFGSSVPFADVTATPATPEEIQEIAVDLALYYLYRHWEGADGANARGYRTDALEALVALRAGEDDLDGVDRAKNYEGANIARYSAADPVFAGVDANGVKRTHGL